jgi:uncharacterized caspase-like protein
MKKTLLIFFLFSNLLIYAQQKGELYAVIVGVSEYAQSGNNLTYSHKDAIEMYNLLKTQTTTANLKLLTNKQATRDSVLKAANELFTKTKPEDIVLLFFSGHGNEGYFLAHDNKLTFESLQAVFKKTKAKRKLIFADACYSGTFRSSQQSSATNIYANIGNNVLLFLSSRSNQTSIETASMKNGVFTYFLIAGLKGGADANKDRIITAKELFTFVHPRVKEKTKESQIPVMWGKFNDNMVIFDWKNRNQ